MQDCAMSSLLRTIAWLWLIVGVAAAGLMQMERTGAVRFSAGPTTIMGQPWVAVAHWAGVMPTHPLPVFLLGVFINGWLLLGLSGIFRR